jgi:hypothetical protein
VTSPLCGVIHRIPWEGDLPAVGRNLDDASAALSAKVRQRGTDQMDRPDQVRRDDVLDLSSVSSPLRAWISLRVQRVSTQSPNRTDWYRPYFFAGS